MHFQHVEHVEERGRKNYSRPLVVQHFESVNDVFETECTGKYATTNKRGWTRYFNGATKNASRSNRTWLGVESYNEAHEALINGWPDGRKRGNIHVERLHFPPIHIPTVRRVRKMSDFGDEVDMQRVYAGDLDHAWESRVRGAGTMVAAPAVVIMCNTGIRGGQDSDDLFWTGAVVCNMTRWLVESGRTVSVISHSYADTCGEADYYTSIVVKDFGQPLDEEMLFAHTALGAMHRIVMFRTRTLCGSVRMSSDMGLSRYSINYSSEYVNRGKSAKEIHIDRILSEKQARAFLEGQAKEFGSDGD